MELKPELASILSLLRAQIGYHRELHELCRLEKIALIEADIKKIQDYAQRKLTLIEAIQGAEADRRLLIDQFVRAYGNASAPRPTLTLSDLILFVQDEYPAESAELHKIYVTLSHLVREIQKHNAEVQSLIEKSLGHIAEMKKNILGTSDAVPQGYNKTGAKPAGSGSSRMISKEI